MYIRSVFMVYFVNSLQQQITGNLLPYVMSDFASHSLVPVTGIVSQILGGVLKLPIAQLIDVWGRPQGLVIMIALCTIGLILMAVCNNVQTYAAAQCFYWVGYNGIGFILNVFIADTSNLRNRALAFAFATTPYIATTLGWSKGCPIFLREQQLEVGIRVLCYHHPFRRPASTLDPLLQSEKSGQARFYSGGGQRSHSKRFALLLLHPI